MWRPTFPDRVEHRVFYILATIVAFTLTVSIPGGFLLGSEWVWLLSTVALGMAGLLAAVVAGVGLVFCETRLEPKRFTALVAVTAGVGAGLTNGLIEPTLAGGIERHLMAGAYLLFSFFLTYAMFPVRSGIVEPRVDD